MKKNNFGFIPLIILVLVLVGLAVTGGFYFRAQKKIYTPSPSPISSSTPRSAPFLYTPEGEGAIFLGGSGIVPVSGNVPAGWMFEGQLNIKLLDADKKVIASAVGKETIPGSWQSGEAADFSGTLTFSTKARIGYLVIESDNPSGDPSNLKSYAVPVLLNCTPRPACLDSSPRCLIPETSDMCSRNVPAY